jgi:hypothetical protein
MTRPSQSSLFDHPNNIWKIKEWNKYHIQLMQMTITAVFYHTQAPRIIT